MKKGRESRENWERFLKLPIPPNGASQLQIARAVGCTHQRVSQIEKKALKKLLRMARQLRVFRDAEKSAL